MRNLLLPLAIAILAPFEALAEDRVRLDVKEVDLDYGRLHIMANLVGYEFAGRGDGFNSSAHALFEVGDSMSVRAHVSMPLIGFLANTSAPVRLEAAVDFHTTKNEVKTEQLVLDSEIKGEMLHTTSVNVPVQHKISTGLAAGVIYRDTPVSQDADEATPRSRHLTAILGLQMIDASGGDVKVKGYNRSFFEHRWTVAGLDLLYDVVQDFDVSPSKAPGKFGGRLWAEVILGKKVGMSGRIDLGYMPGGTGLYFVIGLGGGFHLL
jgi:hypothetical protein